MNVRATRARMAIVAIAGRWILYDMVWVTGDAVDVWIVPADGSGEPRLVSEDAYRAAWQPVLAPIAD